MKNLLKKLLVIAAVILSISATINLTSPQSANAASCRYFLGMASWDCNTGFSTSNSTPPTESELKAGIWAAVANVAMDLTVIAAYLVLGYVIYGGYLYIFSAGDPGKVATGKKALTQAFIGLAIVLSSNVILNAIRAAIGANFRGRNCATANCTDDAAIVTAALTWVIGIAGVVALIFVVYGGIAYTTSAGDPGKLQKAKNIITYALIGLAIVALSETIVMFVSSNITKATTPTASDLNKIAITKEIHENQIN